MYNTLLGHGSCAGDAGDASRAIKSDGGEVRVIQDRGTKVRNDKSAHLKPE